MKTRLTLLCQLAFWGTDMNRFEESKADTLNRLFWLRIMNAIGMIAWRDDRYGGAEQRLRMLHPLSWVWMVLAILIGIVLHGIIEVWAEIKNTLRRDCVWW